MCLSSYAVKKKMWKMAIIKATPLSGCCKGKFVNVSEHLILL